MERSLKQPRAVNGGVSPKGFDIFFCKAEISQSKGVAFLAVDEYFHLTRGAVQCNFEHGLLPPKQPEYHYKQESRASREEILGQFQRAAFPRI